MAPNISDKKQQKVCKKYSHAADHSKYKQWEKDRRDRFNVKLEDLASCLPNYDKENPWKKVEIVENAILALRSNLNNAFHSKPSDTDTIRKLSAEINNLKNVIIQFTSFRKADEDIFKLTSDEIFTVLNRVILNKKKKVRTQDNNSDSEYITGDTCDDEDTAGEDDLAFVARIAQSNDHCYSVSVTEPNLTVDAEEVVETQDSAAPAPGYVTILQSGDPLPLPAPVTLLPPPAPAEEEGFITLSLGILQIISINDLAAAAGVRTIFVNKGSKSLVLYQHQPPPLVTTDPSTDLCFTKVAIPRLRVQKKAKKTRKTYVRKKLFKSKKSTVSLKPAESSS